MATMSDLQLRAEMLLIVPEGIELPKQSIHPSTITYF